MQPTYLPWSGYFNLIGQVDKFVFLDDVQFERQSWQSRNRILLQGKEHLLVVPVNRDALGTPINQITINTRNDWRKTHWRTLQAAYGKAVYGVDVLALLEPFYTGTSELLLSQLNQSIIRKLSTGLGIETTFFCSSELNCEGERSARLIRICEALGCDEYLSPVGAMQYLQEDNFESNMTIKLSFQRFNPAPYKQHRSDQFISHLSMIDVIANNGLDYAKTYIA